MLKDVVRIAMWSGPRNLSTALMRSFEARGDCAVEDEPLYANYLATSGVRHPMRAEIIASHEVDPEKVIAQLLGPVPGGKPIYYHKQMPHQLYMPNVRRDWLGAMRHAILIRAPERVVASFDAKRPAPTLEDIAAPQMDRLAGEIEDATGAPPPVIEAEDIRIDPEGMLRALCAALEIPFTDRMLSWPAGSRRSDGVWGAHWYPAVEASTGFAPPAGPVKTLAPHLAEVAAAARPSFERLQARKLRPLREP